MNELVAVIEIENSVVKETFAYKGKHAAQRASAKFAKTLSERGVHLSKEALRVALNKGYLEIDDSSAVYITRMFPIG